MQPTGTRTTRLLALFLLGVALFDFPFLALFNIRETVLGIPVLFAYLFGVWLLLIVLTCLVMESDGRGSNRS